MDKTIDDHVRTEMGLNIPNFWDKNAISPGTRFMDSIYERIIYERQHKQMFEQMRNTRYEDLLKSYYKNTYSH